MAWLTGWNKRKSKTINGSTAGIQTDYQMKLTIHKSTGTDTATDIYLGTNVRDDFGDVRFTLLDGSTLLSYWIESYTTGSVATFWVKIPSIPTSPGTTSIYIYYDNSIATSISNSTDTLLNFAAGGTITTYNQYRIHTFNNSSTFIPEKSMNVEALIVAGGGSGGSGGGGAGGLIYNPSYSVSLGAMSVTVGPGGAAPPPNTTGNDGTNSVFGILTAIGGGGGGYCSNGRNGGSGGGGDAICTFTDGGYLGGTGTVGQGNNGGGGYQRAGIWRTAGGGGGAGNVGQDGHEVQYHGNANGAGGAGGVGLAYSITGTSIYYAGGGGGAGNNIDLEGIGGFGGGGAWNVDGTPNTGGGGGGNFKAGGSGIVIVRYPYRQIASPEPTFSITGGQESLPGTLNISSTPSGANIYIDGAPQTGITTPAPIMGIIPGDHTYKLTLTGYQDVTGPFTIISGMTTTVSINLVLLEGCISFSTNVPGASIYIDGNLQTVTTPAIICGLSLGPHTYELRLSGYQTITGDITLSSGHGETISRTLTPLAQAGFGGAGMLMIGGLLLGAVILSQKEKEKRQEKGYMTPKKL